MEATKLLEKQHREVEEILAKLEKGKGDAEALLESLANNLAAHMTIEQELFYPAIAEVDHEVVLESYEEHALAEVALKRLLASDVQAETFHARVVALKELIQHHVQEEEETLFPQVKKALEDERLAALGKQMKQRFDQVVAAGYESAVPRGFARTSSDVSRKALKKPASKRKAA